MIFARRPVRRQNSDACFFSFACETEESAFVLFGCALFAACLFVYVFYQPGEVEPARRRRARCIWWNARKRHTKICAT